MSQPDPRTADKVAIIELSAHFAWLIDHRDGQGVPELFVAEGRYGYGDVWCEGRQEIEDFYERRRKPGTRTSRHVFSNVWVHFESENRAQSHSILTLFATDGDPASSASPLSIIDYTDELIKMEDGGWRYSERRVSPVFGHMPRLMEKSVPVS
jgi:hypothetical protein